MKAAIVSHSNQPPIYGDFETPTAAPGENTVAATAAALSQLVKSRASGTHYSSSGKFPFVAGIDGVGHLDDGRRVYFLFPDAPYGSMAEKVVIKASQCIPLPDDLDDITAAAIANPGMSSWAAFKERARLVAEETVLVNGATGTSGRLAIQIAKYLGAGKVIDEMLQATIPGGFTIATRAIPLSSVEAAWNTEAGSRRTVFVNQK
jgi:NADPH:quinone reductase-like Zn-dependent oxidoreductase